MCYHLKYLPWLGREETSVQVTLKKKLQAKKPREATVGRIFNSSHRNDFRSSTALHFIVLQEHIHDCKSHTVSSNDRCLFGIKRSVFVGFLLVCGLVFFNETFDFPVNSKDPVVQKAGHVPTKWKQDSLTGRMQQELRAISYVKNKRLEGSRLLLLIGLKTESS